MRYWLWLLAVATAALVPATALATGPNQRPPQPQYVAGQTDTRMARDEPATAKRTDKANPAAAGGHFKPTGTTADAESPPRGTATAAPPPHPPVVASARATPAPTVAAAAPARRVEKSSVVAAAQHTEDQPTASVIVADDPQVHDTAAEVEVAADTVEADLADESPVAEDASPPASELMQPSEQPGLADEASLAAAPDEAESADLADGGIPDEVASDPQPVEPGDATADADPVELAHACGASDCPAADNMDSAPAAAQVGAHDDSVLTESQASDATSVAVAAATVEAYPAPAAIAAPIVSPPAVLSLSVREAVSTAPGSATGLAAALIAMLGLLLTGWAVHRSTRLTVDGLAPRPSRAAAAGAVTILGGLLAIGLWFRGASGAPALASSSPLGSAPQAGADVPPRAVDPALLSPVEVSASADPNAAEVGKVVTLQLHLTNHGTTQLWGTDIATDGPWDAYEALSSGSNAVLVQTPTGWTIQTRLTIPVGESREVRVVLVPRQAGEQHFRFVATGRDFLGRPVGPTSVNPTAPGT